MTALSVTAISIGERDREDLGDVQGLAESIAAVGLLHPIVVTADHVLVAGGRRLAAVKHLGWTEVAVTIATHLTETEKLLRAEADENTCRKSLSPLEASKARERRAVVLAPLAEARVGGRPSIERMRNKAGLSALLGTSSKLDAVPATVGATRKVAAIGTGYSGSTLDKVDKVRAVAADPKMPAPVRAIAERGLTQLAKTGMAVDPVTKDVNAAIEKFVEADDSVIQARLRHNVSKLVYSTRTGLPLLDVQLVAAALDSEGWDRIDSVHALLDEWFAALTAARPRTLHSVRKA